MTLPSSIEAHLTEAGFTQTELLILSHSLEGKPQSLRELAAKTHKSTGVLDQAMKKLLRRKIMIREKINGTPKFALSSMSAVLKWIEDDVKSKTAVLQRRKHDFESFVSTLRHSGARPKIEYFEGEKGILRAYHELLTFQPKELYQFLPSTQKEEDDPLAAFHAEYARERKKRNIFLHVISNDTALGKRFQSRDPFCFRKTVLVPEARCPIPFEKIICGDVVACFHHQEQRACFIRFPELAEAEKALFEILQKGNRDEALVVPTASSQEAMHTDGAKIQRTLRELFFSRKGICTFILFTLFSAAITSALYFNNLALNKQRIREKITSIAATAALQIQAEDVNAIHTMDDVSKPEYNKLVTTMDEIRKQNDQIINIYLIRSTSTTGQYEFVADADAINSYEQIDTDHDGLITVADQLGLPGLPYDVTQMDALMNGEVTEPIANSKPYTDSWGSFFTAYAPVKNADESVAALLAVDMWERKVGEFTRQSFNPLHWFIGVLIFLVFLWITAFHRDVYSELFAMSKTREFLLTVAGSSAIALLLTGVLYVNNQRINTERVREKVLAIASTGAPLFQASDIEQLHSTSDMQLPAYSRVVEQLDQIRQENDGVKYVYIIRPKEDSNMFEFVADSYGLHLEKGIDFNADGVIGDEDEIPIPGMPYDVSEILGAKEGMQGPVADTEPYTDQWGTFISGFAPIRDANGVAVAVLGVDKIANDVHDLTLETVHPLRIFFSLLLLLLVVQILIFHRVVLIDAIKFLCHKNVATALICISLLALVVTVGMYKYTFNIMKEEIGNRLMSIVATAAPQIDASDLKNLNKAADMKTEQYQRVFTKLNEIRDNNENIKFVYIMRPSGFDDNMLVFVADADSNYYLPASNDADPVEVVPPGTYYDSAFFEKNYAESAMKHPIVQKDFMTDKWGTYLSAAAPVIHKNGESVAVLGIDMDVSDVYKANRQRFNFPLWFIEAFIGILFFALTLSQDFLRRLKGSST